ncbi:hypothetical protein BJV78DRAFT_1221269 [Lactifluus subvellereus]|nr:hypothetical protein BJV78DRAFT_1221269 [Lactifluus subvellereus]
MPPRTRPRCQICNEESRYTCSSCLVEYCSVPCYKQHKEATCGLPSQKRGGESDDDAKSAKMALNNDANVALGDHHSSEDDETAKEVPLRPLTSLKWPYVPEESAYPDPLKRDDPKPLRMAQYEAIATSHAVRAALTGHPKLKDTLRSVDRLRGSAREEALQACLGVSRSDVTTPGGGGIGTAMEMGGIRVGEEKEAMRELAEAIEAAVRRNREDALGLDWDQN